MKTLVSSKEKKRTWKNNYLGHKQPILSFGPDVVGLQQLVALVDVGVGMGVMTVGGDRVVVVEVWGRHHCWWWCKEKLGIGAEFERTTKSEDENKHKKEALCKLGGIGPFCKKASFRLHFQFIFGFHFWKSNQKVKQEVAEKEPKWLLWMTLLWESQL